MVTKVAPPVAYGRKLLPMKPEADEAPALQETPARTRSRPMVDKSAAVLVYLHPEGKKQLRIFAAESGQGVRVHDLMIQAMEEWAAKRGLSGPWRVPSDKPRRHPMI